jgi:hypothetical protein
MWIFMNDSFLSIVDKAKTKGCLLVRARKKGDIEAVFPGAKVRKGEGTDYKYRADVPRDAVAAAIAARVTDIDYSNFKDSIPTKDSTRQHAYHAVWAAGFELER